MATKGINDYNIKDDDTSNSDIDFVFPFTLVVTHNTSFDILFDIISCMWNRMDKGLNTDEYNIQQALLHNIDPKNKDILYFNHHFEQAMFYWFSEFDKTLYRESFIFHLEGGPQYL